MNMIYLIRHGQTDWNALGKMQGQTNIPLNEIGREQAKTASIEVAKVKVEHIFSSNLDRAKETSEIINGLLGLNLKIALDNRISEFCIGDFEGREWKTIPNDEWELFNSDRKKYNAETLDEIFARVKSFFDELKQKNIKNALVVTHTGTMRMMMYVAENNIFNTQDFIENYMRKLSFDNAQLVEWKGGYNG